MTTLTENTMFSYAKIPLLSRKKSLTVSLLRNSVKFSVMRLYVLGFSNFRKISCPFFEIASYAPFLINQYCVRRLVKDELIVIPLCTTLKNNQES